MPPIPRKKRLIWPPASGQEVEGTVVQVENQVENPSTYNLEDGTQLRMRTVLTEVIRLEGIYNDEGETIYVLKSQNIVTSNVAEKYRRPKGA